MSRRSERKEGERIERCTRGRREKDWALLTGHYCVPGTFSPDHYCIWTISREITGRPPVVLLAGRVREKIGIIIEIRSVTKRCLLSDSGIILVSVALFRKKIFLSCLFFASSMSLVANAIKGNGGTEEVPLHVQGSRGSIRGASSRSRRS